MKSINVLLVPPEAWTPQRRAWTPGSGPTAGEVDRLLADRHGIRMELLDPHGLPLNPLANMHPLYRGVDPLRALKVLGGYRDIDLVMSVFESSVLLALLLRRVSGFKPKIAMWDIVPEETWKVRSRMQDLVVPRIDHLFLLADTQREYLRRRWDAAEKSSVVWQHVDTEFYSPGPASVDGPILAIGEDVGRDWPTLIQAVGDLDVDVIIKTKRKLDLTGVRRARIRQIDNRLSFGELRELFARSRFVVVPVRETLNVSGVGSVLEAMAMGKAVVLSDSLNMRDYILPGQTALTCPVGDPLALRAAITTLLENDALRAKLGMQGRARAVELYSRPAFAARMAQQIRELLAAPTRT